MFISDPTISILDPGSELFLSRIRIKEFMYINPKNFLLTSRKYDLRVAHPGSRIQGFKKALDPGSGSATLRTSIQKTIILAVKSLLGPNPNIPEAEPDSGVPIRCEPDLPYLPIRLTGIYLVLKI
jgi:hypothetical protein